MKGGQRLEILGQKMNSQLIVIVQVLIAILFVLWILSRRGSSPKPTVLNLFAENQKKNVRVTPITKTGDQNLFEGDNEVKVKVLNVIFMWNGHSWDAYEVFGLPAGSSVERVRERYNELQSKSDEGQRLFLREALKAIENKISS